MFPVVTPVIIPQPPLRDDEHEEDSRSAPPVGIILFFSAMVALAVAIAFVAENGSDSLRRAKALILSTYSDVDYFECNAKQEGWLPGPRPLELARFREFSNGRVERWSRYGEEWRPARERVFESGSGKESGLVWRYLTRQEVCQ